MVSETTAADFLVKRLIDWSIEVGGSTRALLLLELLPVLKHNDSRDILERAQKSTEDWNALMETRTSVQDKPMKPQVDAWKLGKRSLENSIVSGDTDTISTRFARQLPTKHDHMYLLSSTLASMANRLPYAVSARLTIPST